LAALIMTMFVSANDDNDVHLPWTHHDKLILAHATCGSIAFMLAAPIAVLIGRLGRSIPGWVMAHRLIQVLITFPLAIAAIVLGGKAVDNSLSGHLSDTHKKTGVALFILLVLQIVLGAVIHHLFNPNRTRRPSRNWAHVVLGITIIILGVVQVRLGMGEYYRWFGRDTPKVVICVYWIVVSFGIAGYLFGVVNLVRGKGPGMEKPREIEISDNKHLETPGSQISQVDSPDVEAAQNGLQSSIQR